MELTHEIILGEWTLLRSLIDANRERIKLREQLLVNAELWFATRTPVLPQGESGYLYQGVLYRQAQKYVEQQQRPHDCDFRIAECFRVSKKRRQRNFALAFGGIGVAAAVILTLVLWLQQSAANEKLRADTNATAQAVAQTQAEVNATAKAVAERQARSSELARATAEAQADAQQVAKNEQVLLAQSRKLAAASGEALKANRADLALLLAVEAYRQNQTVEAKSGLLTAVQTYANSTEVLSKYLRNEDPASLMALAFSPDMKLLASGEADGSVTLWDVESGNRVTSLESIVAADSQHNSSPAAIRFLTFDENGEDIYYLYGDQLTWWEWPDYEPGKVKLAFPSVTDGFATAVAVSPNFQYAAVSRASGQIWPEYFTDQSIEFQDISSGMYVPTQIFTSTDAGNLLQTSEWTTLTFSPDSDTLAVGLGNRAAAGIGSILLWDVLNNREMGDISLEFEGFAIKRVDCVAMTNDLIFVADAQGVGNEITMLPLSPDTPGVPKYSGSTKAFFSGCPMAVSTNGRYLASGNLLLWDLRSESSIDRSIGRMLGLNGALNLYELKSPNEPYEDNAEYISFSPDSQKLIAKAWFMSKGQKIFVWDVRTGERLDSDVSLDQSVIAESSTEVVDVRRGIKYVALDSLVVAGGDRIEMRDVTTGQLVGTFEARAGHLVLSPDGRYLVSYGSPSHGAVFPLAAHIWNVDPDSWAATACTIANRNLTFEEWTTYLPDQPYRKTCEEITDRN